MPDRLISALTALTAPAADDYLPIVDISEGAAASKNKRITVDELHKSVPSGTAAAPSMAFESDPDTGVFSAGANTLGLVTGGTQRVTIDSAGRTLIGTSTSRAIGGSGAGDLQVEVSGIRRCATFVRNGGAPIVSIGSTGATGIGDTTLVSSGASVGQIEFAGADGTDVQSVAATIAVAVDGTPAANDMPGRLVFSTTASGAALPTERMRIDSTGFVSLAGDTDTGFYRPAADTLAFVEGGVEAFRLTSAGRLGIGTIAPGDLVEINNAAADTGLYIRSRGANNRKAHIFFLTNNSGGGTTGGTIFHDGNGLAFNNTTNTTGEILRIDSGGRTLIGTNTARATPSGTSAFAGLQLEGANNNTSAISITSTAGAVAGRAANIRTARIRGTAAVLPTDILGQWSFLGYDGADFVEGAVIEGVVDGTVSTGVMPTYLRFGVSTTNTSAEQLRLTNTGTIARRQSAPVAVNTTATLTIDNLKNGIITSTTVAPVTMTLPTGTLSAAGFTGIYTDLSFEWSVINTGPSAVTVQGGTAHTLVGSGTVAAGTSGRFQSRASATNTFISYRIA